VGSNTITTVVTAQDGVTTKTYTLIVTRVGSPTVTTLAASAVQFNAATLNGKVNPNGLLTTAHFEYGPTTAYGTSTLSISVGSGSAAVPATGDLTNLTPTRLIISVWSPRIATELATAQIEHSPLQAAP